MKARATGEIVGYLEGYLEGAGRRVRLPIHTLPCRIGRRVELEIQLSDPRVSQLHAEIYPSDGELVLRDLGSTNGTFVNGTRIEGPVPLADGDVVRIAVLEFRFTRPRGCGARAGMDVTAVITDESPRLVFGDRDLVRLIDEEAVLPFYQPVHWLATDQIAGYEILGRGNLEGLPRSPGELFQMASTYGMEANLSELFRTVGVRDAERGKLDGMLFVNMHPAEVKGPQLVQSIRELREEFPCRPMTLEVHEGAVTDALAMRRLRAELASLEVRIAYDDFGAGMSRLNELAEVPPDVLKFDASLIRQLDESSPGKQQLVAALVRMAKALGVETLAEGVETEAEKNLCLHLGFDLAQGYAFGEPKPVDQYR